MKNIKTKSLFTGLLGFVSTVFIAAGILLGLGTISAQAETGSENAVKATMIQGAYIRNADTVEKMGIRFGFTMSGTDYNDLMSKVGDGKTYKSVRFGMLIAPNAYQAHFGELNPENVFGAKPKYDWETYNTETGEWEYNGTNGTNGSPVRIINVSDDVMKEERDGTRVLYGSMVDVKANNLRVPFVGVGYIQYTLADGTLDYDFLAYNDNVRSMTYVAQRAIEAGADTYGVIYDTYVKSFVESGTTATYTVEEYKEGEDGAYVKTSNQYSATINATVEYTPDDIDGYYFDEAQSKLNGVVYENGSLVLKAYYNKIAVVTDNTQYVVEKAASKGIAIPFASEYGTIKSVTDKAGNEITYTVSGGNVNIAHTDLAYGDYELTIKGKKATLTATNVHSVDKLFTNEDFNTLSGSDWNGQRTKFSSDWEWYRGNRYATVAGLAEDIVIEATTWHWDVANPGGQWANYIAVVGVMYGELNGLGHSITATYTQEIHEQLLALQGNNSNASAPLFRGVFALVASGSSIYNVEFVEDYQFVDNTQYVVEKADSKGIVIPFASEYGTIKSVTDKAGKAITYTVSGGNVNIAHTALAYGDYEIIIKSKSTTLTATNVHSVDKLFTNEHFNTLTGSDWNGKQTKFQADWNWYRANRGATVAGLAEDIVIEASTWHWRAMLVDDGYTYEICVVDSFVDELNGLGHKITVNYSEETHKELINTYNENNDTAITAAGKRIGGVFSVIGAGSKIHNVRFNITAVELTAWNGYVSAKVESGATIDNCVFDVNIVDAADWDGQAQLCGVINKLFGSLTNSVIITRGMSNAIAVTGGGYVKNCVVISKMSASELNLDENNNPYGTSVTVTNVWQYTSVANAITGATTDGNDGYYETNSDSPSKEGIKTLGEVLGGSVFLSVVDGNLLWNGTQIADLG